MLKAERIRPSYFHFIIMWHCFMFPFYFTAVSNTRQLEEQQQQRPNIAKNWQHQYQVPPESILFKSTVQYRVFESTWLRGNNVWCVGQGTFVLEKMF